MAKGTSPKVALATSDKAVERNKQKALMEASDLAAVYTQNMLPRMIKEIDKNLRATPDEPIVWNEEKLTAVFGRWLALTYSLGFMDAVERKKIVKLYL